MRFLQAAHDVNERHFRQALDMLQKDLTREKTVASEFKREFASLSRVLQAREQRHKDQQDIMAAEVRHSRTVAEEARKVGPPRPTLVLSLPLSLVLDIRSRS